MVELLRRWCCSDHLGIFVNLVFVWSFDGVSVLSFKKRKFIAIRERTVSWGFHLVHPLLGSSLSIRSWVNICWYSLRGEVGSLNTRDLFKTDVMSMESAFLGGRVVLTERNSRNWFFPTGQFRNLRHVNIWVIWWPIEILFHHVGNDWFELKASVPGGLLGGFCCSACICDWKRDILLPSSFPPVQKFLDPSPL